MGPGLQCSPIAFLRYVTICGFVILASSAKAQFVNAIAASAGSEPSASARTIRGQVVNATNGMAIPRALVSLGSRQVLTDYQGRFTFPQFSDTQAFVTVAKPGYNQNSDPDDGFLQHRIADLDGPVDIQLFPDGLITGFVTGRDGLPLAQMQVVLRHVTFDLRGPHWSNSRFSMTDSRGEYRLLVPAGRYRLGVSYSQHQRDSGEAVLPQFFPELSSSDALGYFAIAPGEEKHVDLRPKMGKAYSVLLHVEQLEARSNLMLSAVTETGEVFYLPYSSGVVRGDYRVSLPSGSYVLRGRSDTQTDVSDGETRVTVAGGDVAGVVLPLVRGARLPVEVSVHSANPSPRPAGPDTLESSSTLEQMPNAQQLNLYLHNVSDNAEGISPDVTLRQGENKTYEFRVPPGRYRLASNTGGNWFVQSATYGGITNLLTTDVVIGEGSAGAPILIVVNNQKGNVHGSVDSFAADTNPWVYLIPTAPALAPPNPLPIGANGAFYTSVPPGSYSVLALAHRVHEDMRDPEVVARITAGAKTVEVTPGSDVVVNLQVIQPQQVRQ